MIHLVRDGTRLRIEGPPEALDRLQGLLCYTQTRFLRGWELKAALRAGLPRVENTLVRCYRFDSRGRLQTSAGFLARLLARLRELGQPYRLQNLWTIDDPRRWTPDLARVRDHYPTADADQWRCFRLMCKHLRRGGRVAAAAGWGKGNLIGMLCVAYGRLKFDVVIKGTSVLRQRLLPELQGHMLNVGSIGGGRPVHPSARILVVSADSLHRIDPRRPDVVLVDEGQKAVTDKIAAGLGRYHRVGLWSLSASFGQRRDGRNAVEEQLFGPIRFQVSHDQAVAAGRVVRIVIVWRRLYMDLSPAAGYEEQTAVRRHGVWRHDTRNALLAACAREHPDDQVLITTACLEHAVHLKARLPHYTLVYAAGGLTATDRDFYVRRGLLEETEPEMTPQRRQRLTERFEQGKLRHVIATTVFNYGVSFNKLAVVIRAEADGSRENAIQTAARPNRRCAGKDYAVVYDCWDVWDSRFKRAAQARYRAYRDAGYLQLIWNEKSGDYLEFTP